MPNSNYFDTLLNYAEAHSNLGRSVIPLLGDTDPSRPKVPAVPWASFQRSRASLADYRQWFKRSGFAGLGIVTGYISQLVVLDFDSEATFKDFAAQYPDLTETHTVRSANRQLPHLYFHLPSHLSLDSQKGQGIDVLSNGRYVVAPPTVINNQPYKITRGAMPKPLTERDIRRIQAFLNAHKAPVITAPPKNISPEIKPATSKATIDYKPSAYNLQTYYQHLASTGGRNEALFRTSLYARDTGWTAAETQNCLVKLHTEQAGSTAHKRETLLDRQREALKTILSAYSHPAQSLKAHQKRQQGQISNSVRESLLEKKMTYFIRTYEGLLQKGAQPGQFITNNEAVEHLKGLVGRDSVLKALRAGWGGRFFFAPPVSPPNTAHAVAKENTLKELNKCYLLERKNQYKSHSGRPQYIFRIPTNQELCDLLGVKNSGSDLLEADDLASAHKTRMGLHRELIKRRPGQYSKRWLARRLGVTRRTINTYNQLLPIHSRPMFVETPISWGNIERLPLENWLSGASIVTQSGKKYPAIRGKASQLLADGQRVTLKQQTANFYWYGDHEPLLLRLDIQHKAEVVQQRQETYIAEQKAVQPPQVPEKPPVPAPKPSKSKPPLPKNLKCPLKNQSSEAQAQQLYETAHKLSPKCLSMVSARRLVLTYEWSAITEALAVVARRHPIAKPIGFLVTHLRSSSNMATHQ